MGENGYSTYLEQLFLYLWKLILLKLKIMVYFLCVKECFIMNDVVIVFFLTADVYDRQELLPAHDKSFLEIFIEENINNYCRDGCNTAS